MNNPHNDLVIDNRECAQKARHRLEQVRAQCVRVSKKEGALDDTAAIGLLAQLTAEGNSLERSIKAYESLLSSNHRLAKVVSLDAAVTPPNWVLPNFIAEGIVLIAGGHGVGKTTTLLPLAMAAAGVHEDGYELAPKHWRHCIYVTEDVSQARLIINGITDHLGLNRGHLLERVHIVEAQRMDPVSVITVGRHYRETYTRTVATKVGDVEIPPLVVFDTMAATFQVENENDNSEASNMIALLKQQFKLPCWIVGHVSKGDLTRDAAKAGSPTLRGASAYEADANQVLYLVKSEDDTRWLVRGKTRFESPWQELMIETGSSTCQAIDVFGDSETLIRRWGIARPAEKSRDEMQEEAKIKAEEYADQKAIDGICDFVGKAQDAGEPVTRTDARNSIKGRRTEKKKELIETLLEQCRLAEISLPPEVTGKNRTATFLVLLSSAEQAEYKDTGKVPEAKIELAKSWFSPE